jgi:hypothetical protein
MVVSRPTSFVIGVGNPLRGDDGVGLARLPRLTIFGIGVDEVSTGSLHEGLREPWAGRVPGIVRQNYRERVEGEDA